MIKVDLAERIGRAVYERVRSEHGDASREELWNALRAANPFGLDGEEFWQRLCGELLVPSALAGQK